MGRCGRATDFEEQQAREARRAAMPITQGHSFLVHPGKGADTQPVIKGVRIERQGELFDMLTELYEGADTQVDVDISFDVDEQGNQNNPCRTLLLDYLASQTMGAGRSLASRLQGVTTRRSNLGLLFLVAGTHKSRLQLLVARFPADQGIITVDTAEKFDLAFVKHVFMKNLRTYKSVLYHCTSIDAGFWNGGAVDKQTDRELSDYWIRDFLASDYRTTAAAGTRRLASAVKRAVTSAGLSDAAREELWGVARMLRNMNGQRISVDSVCDKLSLTPEAANAIRSSLEKPELARERFQFTVAEYDDVIAFRSVELDNGVRLTAPNEAFENLVESQAVPGDGGRTRFTTTGKVVGRRAGKIA
jgi:hypothetical protein